ncbi:hypothetical protein ON010_g6791 [Phytophthora cinnamomi]|nr:hypothetical protein ON010_g6791 [Phytophthora cinnamomi]
MGNHPEYSLSASFKVTVDGFFLRYLASESIVLKVHQAIRGDFKLIGKASVRLSKLLQSKGVVKEPLLAVKSSCCNNDSGPSILGTLNVVLRLSTPVSEIWQVHLRSYPKDILLLSSAGKHSKSDVPVDVLCAEDFNDDNGHSTNELQVTVFACRRLRSYGKTSNGSVSRVPSSYVHYQLLGFPDVFTNIVPESSNPEYDLSHSRQAFTLQVDATLLRFLSKFRFWVTVFDDQVDLDDSAQEDGIVGRCGLMLSDLVNGENIRGWFPLKDENDQHAGDISVLIQWKDPFQVLQLTSSQRARGVNGRPIDMHSLDFDQQHALLAIFSSDIDGRINYRQFLHYAAPSQELELLVAKLKERVECAIDSGHMASVEDGFTVGMDPRKRKRMVISIDDLIQAGEKYGIFLSDTERDLLLATFGIEDSSTESKSTVGNISPTSEGDSKDISLNYLLLHINPRSSCVERLMCHKVRQTVRRHAQEQKKRKPADVVPAPKVFQKFDEANCGRIPRSAFRKCMSALGFDLMSVESEYRELVRTHTQPTSDDVSSDSMGEKATSLTRDGIDLDEDVLEDVTTKPKLPTKQPLRHSSGIGATTGPSVKRVDAPLDTAEMPVSVSTLPATTEFQRRKQAFMDRMKAIASASSKNLVYEQVEKKLQDQRVQAKEKALPRQEFLQQQVRQLHAPQNIHHDAARTLQKQYRHYREQQQQNREASHVKTTIMEADSQLQTILSKWSFADLNDLEDAILSVIERDAPNAKRGKLLSRKQLSYFLSKAPRIALPPALLWQLMDYFAVKETGMVAYRSLLNFVFSTSTEERKCQKKQRLSVLERLLFDVGYASHIFVSAGDMKGTGCISFKRFRESLTRLGVQLSAKELHLVTILLDANGHEILYHALLQLLTQSPHCQQLTKALERCHRFGTALMREKILAFVRSDDGYMNQEELHRILMLLSAHFEPKDSILLFQMIAGNNDSAKRISIDDLCLRLESAAKYGQKSLHDEWNNYDMHHLQRLAWNCRKLICGSYSDLKFEFERFDWRDRGFVSLTEFTSICRRNGFVLFTEDQLKCIAKAFSVKTNGSFGINYRQFLDWTTPPPTVDMDAVEQKLRKFAHDQAGKLSSKQLSDVFAHWNEVFFNEIESSLDGVMTRSNFVKILQTRLGLPLDENEMRALLYTYDPKLEDQIDCNAFLRMNWREGTQARVKLANDAARVKHIAKKDITESDSNLRVSKATRESLKEKPAPTKPQNQQNGDEPSSSSAPGGDPKPGKTPVAILSDYLNWCEERGIDFRGELEACDSTYSGFVTAMNLKETLLRLDFAKVASPSSAEVMVGQLVRRFRSAERTDAVHYTTMLYEITKPASIGADSRWYEQITEHLRSRIRSKANLAGKIDHSDTTNYARLDSAFSHFDRENKGFLTGENLRSGLRALNYELSTEQFDTLMAHICVFRHDGGGLSRTEFDSFVLDPCAPRLLKKLADQLYSEVEPHSKDTMPRVAYLSRLLMECTGASHQSSLSKESFWTQLERALERQVTAWDRLRLQHLFDIKRDGHIAYKLFLKVMSQWRAPTSATGSVLAQGSNVAVHRQVTHVQQEHVPTPENQHRSLEDTTTTTNKPPCARDAILRSLYNQMSSIDFDSQVDIVEEYLRLKDRKHTGSIKMRQLKRVFDQIGLSLSPDAFTSLQIYFPGLASSDTEEHQEQLVAYGKLILALEAMHEHNNDKQAR